MHRNSHRPLAAVVLTLGIAAGALGQQHVQRAALPMRVLDVVSRSTDLGPSDPARVLNVTVSMPFADPVGMQAFIDSVSDPASPNYRHFLTPDEIGVRFGLSEKQVQSVVDHLQSHGIKVTLVGKNRLGINAECTVAQAEAAFNTSIHEFQAIKSNEPGNPRFFAHTTAPSLPSEIAPYVIDIAGLENFTKPQIRILTQPQTLGVYSLAPLYTSGMQGQGRTVAISSFDGFRISTNVPLYYNKYSLPTPPGGVTSNITVTTISGGAGTGATHAEGDLDIQMVLGMAPLCNLRVYDGGSNNLLGVLLQEVTDNAADIITESYGWNLPASSATSAHNYHMSMSGQGITYMAASGDSGTSLEPYSYPDYEPEVLQAGGSIATVTTVNGQPVRGTEVGWSGSGGGWSTNTATFNVQPSWQQGTGVPTTVNKRLVPDVALNASGSGGAYYFYYNGSYTSGYVGTSFASPVFAGSLAVAEQQIISLGGLPADGNGKHRFGRIQNLFYSQNGRSDVWYDITSGSNGTLPTTPSNNLGTGTAGTGWDFVTGWGAINFNAFVSSVVPTCTSPSISSNPANVAVCPGSPATFTVTASGTSPTYQWFRGTTSLSDGGNISGSATASLTINPVGVGDADVTYNVVVSNSCGNAQSNNAQLSVNAPTASIQQNPSGSLICAGSNISLTSTVSCASNPTYQWYNGTNQIGGATGSTLSLNNIQTTDSGSYSLVMTADNGTVTTNPIVVTVTQPAAVVTGPTAASSCRGGTAVLSVTASGSATLTYQWQRNNVALTDSAGHISGSQTSTLSVTTNYISDGGQYSVVVSNDCGPVTSAPATLTACIADFNCDGHVTVQDIFDFLSAWFAQSPAANINGNGVTVQAIFDFLSAWFAGC